MKMKYSEPQPIERNDVLSALASTDEDRAAEAIVRMSYCELDGAWAEQTCLSALTDPRRKVKIAALIGVGHVARRFHSLNRYKVLPLIRVLLDDPEYRGIAEDALDDIAMFVPTGQTNF
jgi:hypothetical protein